jgi:lysyl-tRNA synthetase class 2
MTDRQLFRATACREVLEQRARLLQQLRAFFDQRGFLEVQTPILSRDTVIDRHIDLIQISLDDLPPDLPRRWFLQSSPEAAMKRLLACGLQQIYQIGPVFRAGEFGRYHNPEFTMVEWYRVGDDFEAGVNFLEALTNQLLGTAGCQRLAFSKAFHNAVGLDVFSTTTRELAERAIELDLTRDPDWSDDWDDWVNLLFSLAVQPSLGQERPVLITHFPASQAALAQLAVDNPQVAERFELFYRGVELANGYHELLDPHILRQRNAQANADRRRDGKEVLPEASFLLDAMDQGLPAATGCALGFDRLVMVACGAGSLAEVMPFPIDRA